MYKQLIIFTLLLGVLIIAPSVNADESYQEEHTDEHTAGEQCTSPQETITIIAISSAFAYDQNEYKVSKNTCVKIIFKNAALIEHDINIDEVHGEIKALHVHLANNTDGHDRDGVAEVLVQTPNKDTEYDLYCSVTNHREAGMEVKLIVGNGIDNSTLPGFELISTISLLLTLALIIPKIRKRY